MPTLNYMILKITIEVKYIYKFQIILLNEILNNISIIDLKIPQVTPCIKRIIYKYADLNKFSDFFVVPTNKNPYPSSK